MGNIHLDDAASPPGKFSSKTMPPKFMILPRKSLDFLSTNFPIIKVREATERKDTNKLIHTAKSSGLIRAFQ